MSAKTSSSDAVIQYHERTKHHPHRYARSAGVMDWKNQPNPFRRYNGADLLPLELGANDRGLGAHAAMGIDPRVISDLFFFGLSLSAWKEASGARWALRVNPSSGNLHPVEGYLLCGAEVGLAGGGGVFHYAPREHALERRATLPPEMAAQLFQGLPDGAVVVGLTAIYLRESWKYGERAFRYSQLDLGHAIAALTVAAELVGCSARLLTDVDDESIARLLGVAEQEGPGAERAQALLVVWPRPSGAAPSTWSGTAPGLRLAGMNPAEKAPEDPPAASGPGATPDPAAEPRPECRLLFQGRPNRLCETAHPWPAIGEVQRATQYTLAPATAVAAAASATVDGAPPTGNTSPRSGWWRQVVRRRRTALAMDGETGLAHADFLALLHALQPSTAWPWAPRIHLAYAIHRVEGLVPGLYLQPRDPRAVDALRDALASDFAWAPVATGDSGASLFLLREADLQEEAEELACHQPIAGAGAFSVTMLAEFEAPLREFGPWFYRRLFWEAGFLGQIFYLQAEVARPAAAGGESMTPPSGHRTLPKEAALAAEAWPGMRATGLGCFFDDEVHRLLGIEGRSHQVLYQLALGRALNDTRLRTIDAYAHLQRGGGSRKRRAPERV